MIERKLLGGTDGFRGEAQLDNPDMGYMNEVTVANLSAALVAHQRENGIEGPVVIARDTRPSGRRLLMAAVGGVAAQGAEIIELDIAPTPVAQRIAEDTGAAATIVITASHNRYSDNGWKGMLGSNKPTKEQSRQISDKAWDMAGSGSYASTFMHTSSYETERAQKFQETYVQTTVQDVEERFGEKPLAGKILVVDGAFGAAKSMTPAIFRRLGATVEEFSCGDGLINEGCGAADLTGLRAYLAARPELIENPNFLGAVANDGDADRMMAIGTVQQRGETRLVELDGNHAMWLLAQGPGIVGTDYTNSGLVTRLQAEGVGFEYCENGDSYVTQALRAKQSAGEPWTRGGEFSGHFVDLEWLSSGDGLRTAALFAATAADRDMNFGDIFKALPLWHQKMSKVHMNGVPQSLIIENEQYLQAVSQAEQALGSEGRLLLRPSGTEPVFRVWGEAVQPTQLHAVVTQLSRVINDIVRPHLI
jgi:phosphoglucosamine mutase